MMLAALLHRLRHPHAVSLDWLRDQDRRESRIHFEGVSIRFPLKKLLNEHPVWNRAKLMKNEAA